MVPNALAAAAVGLFLGVSPDAAAAGLTEAELSPWRMEVTLAPSGVVVINDAYNANPESMRAALRALAAMRAEGASRQYGTDNDANLLGQIKAKSKGKVKFNNIDSAAFQKAAIPIAKSIAKLVGDEAFVNAVMKAIQ